MPYGINELDIKCRVTLPDGRVVDGNVIEMDFERENGHPYSIVVKFLDMELRSLMVVRDERIILTDDRRRKYLVEILKTDLL